MYSILFFFLVFPSSSLSDIFPFKEMKEEEEEEKM
jgi:hypothetical protein